MTKLPEGADWRPTWEGDDLDLYRKVKAEIAADPNPIRVLRSGLQMSQTDVADLLGTTQSAVSKLEAKGDPRLSQVREIIESKGGRLKVIAEFDDISIDLMTDA